MRRRAVDVLSKAVGTHVSQLQYLKIQGEKM
jgi:hypothetical protein